MGGRTGLDLAGADAEAEVVTGVTVAQAVSPAAAKTAAATPIGREHF
jgi:hypothetical protein